MFGCCGESERPGCPRSASAPRDERVPKAKDTPGIELVAPTRVRVRGKPHRSFPLPTLCGCGPPIRLPQSSPPASCPTIPTRVRPFPLVFFPFLSRTELPRPEAMPAAAFCPFLTSSPTPSGAAEAGDPRTALPAATRVPDTRGPPASTLLVNACERSVGFGNERSRFHAPRCDRERNSPQNGSEGSAAAPLPTRVPTSAARRVNRGQKTKRNSERREQRSAHARRSHTRGCPRRVPNPRVCASHPWHRSPHAWLHGTEPPHAWSGGGWQPLLL